MNLMMYIFCAAVLIGMAAAAAGRPPGYPSNITTLLQSYGYPVESYQVTTEDGYILSMQRVRRCGSSCRGVVMFQHGLLDCAIGINLNEPHEDLMLMLADAGYDVFYGNNRGNGYSMGAVHFSDDTDQFWRFSFDEMARYDLPAQTRFALDTARASQLVYIGHSEGTIQAFAGFLNHTVASWVKLYVALAPVGRVGNQKSEFLSVLAELDTATILGALGVRQFSLSESIHRFAPDICIIDPSVCLFVMDAIAGPTNHLNASRQYFYVVCLLFIYYYYYYLFVVRARAYGVRFCSADDDETFAPIRVLCDHADGESKIYRNSSS